MNVQNVATTEGRYRLLRSVSMLFAAACFILLLPLFILLALAIYLETGLPIFFRQQRLGYRGQEFTIFKFRTMYVDAHPYGESPEGLEDRRITRVGRVLRKYALDEPPQLINILKGDMVFIGPRPLILRELEEFHQSYPHLLKVREQGIPGMTSPWVIKPDGIKTKPTYEMLLADYHYVLQRSFWMDLRILQGTMLYLVKK